MLLMILPNLLVLFFSFSCLSLFHSLHFSSKTAYSALLLNWQFCIKKMLELIYLVRWCLWVCVCVVFFPHLPPVRSCL